MYFQLSLLLSYRFRRPTDRLVRISQRQASRSGWYDGNNRSGVNMDQILDFVLDYSYIDTRVRRGKG